MKIKSNTILLIAFAAIAIFGIAGICARRGNQKRVSSSHINTNRAISGSKLLDVKAPAKESIQKKDYEGFRVGFHYSNHTPRWVAWELLGVETEGSVSRENKFWQDPEIKGCPDSKDYSNSGYDRGHLCPAADQKWSKRAMHDCFTMSNMCPQAHALNAGAWKTLEEKERLWAKRDSAILIVAGPIYTASDKERIGKTGVRVPSAFYKVIAAPWANKPRGIAFVYPNMTSPGNMQNYVMTIRDVEKLTGLDFFYELDDKIENQIESTTSWREWNHR